jgi:sugar lactone lactonase YvrE
MAFDFPFSGKRFSGSVWARAWLGATLLALAATALPAQKLDLTGVRVADAELPADLVPSGAESVRAATTGLTGGGVWFGSIFVCGPNFTAAGACNKTLTLAFKAAGAVTVNSVAVLTLGAAQQDFTKTSASTCSGAMAANATCTVVVEFAPRFAGSRLGAVVISDSTGAVLAEAPLGGKGVGPQFAYEFGSRTEVGTGFTAPSAVAEDGSGNIVVADTGTNLVVSVPPGTGTRQVRADGLNGPSGLAINGAGDVYVADTGNNRVLNLAVAAPGNTVGAGLKKPEGLAVDAEGNLYVADNGDGRVIEINPATGAQINIGSGWSAPTGVAVDPSGAVFVTDSGKNAVLEVAPGTSAPLTVLSGLNDPEGIAEDAAGDLYIANAGTGQILEMMVGNSTAVPVMTGLVTPHGIAVDAQGNLIAADPGGGAVQEDNRSQTTAMQFAPTPINGTSSDSPQTARLIDVGNQTLRFSSLAYPPDFTGDALGASGGCSHNSVLPIGVGCRLDVEFHPVTPLGRPTSVTRIEAITMTANTPTAPQKVVVLGTETLPDPAITITASPTSSTLGGEVLFTAKVSGSLGTPTGTVTFMEGSAVVGSSNLNSSGVGASDTSSLTGGLHSITASYSGNSVYAPFVSKPVSVTVSRLELLLEGTTNANTIQVLGSAIDFKASIGQAIAGFPISGTLSIADDGVTLATTTEPVSANADFITAGVTTTHLTAGPQNLTLSYSGDANYSPISATFQDQFDIGQIDPVLTLITPGTAQTANKPFTVSVTLTNILSFLPPTGTVKFYAEGVPLATTQVVNDAAAFLISVPKGMFRIEAVYFGDNNYLPATSNVITVFGN